MKLHVVYFIYLFIFKYIKIDIRNFALLKTYAVEVISKANTVSLKQNAFSIRANA